MGNENLKSMKVVMIISLCFNVLFLSSYAALFLVIHKLSTPKGRVEYAARHLKLTNDQKEELSAISNTIQEYRKENSKDRIEEINEMCAELSKDNPDYEKINQLIGKMVDARIKFLGFASGQIQPFIKDLTLEQRKIVVKRFEKIKKILMAE